MWRKKKGKEVAGSLALIGGGETEATAVGLHQEIFSGIDVLTVLPTASAMERPSAKVEFAKLVLPDLKVEALDVLRRTDTARADIIESAEAAEAFLILDGSPLHLRSVLKGSELFSVIERRHTEGVLLAASGAGASILCDPMIDPRGGAYTVGLGIAAGMVIISDHANCPKHLLARSLELLPAGATLVGIDKSTALVQDTEGAWKVLGAGTVTVYEGRGSANCEVFTSATPFHLRD